MSALLLLGMLVVGGVLAWAYLEQESRMAAAAEAEVRRAALRAAKEHSRVVERTRELLTVLSRVPEVSVPGHTDCDRLVREVKAAFPAYANLGVVDASGNLWCSALPVGFPVSSANREWFRATVRSDGFSAGNFQVGTLTRTATLNFGLPIHGPAKERVGVIFAAVDLAAFTSRIALPETKDVVVLFDPAGTVLARSQELDSWQGQSARDTALWRAIASGGSGTARVLGLDGTRRLFAFTRVETDRTLAGILAYGVAEAEVFAQTRALFGRTLVALAGAAVLLMGLVWLGVGTSFARRVGRLRAQAARLSAGDLEARANDGSKDELGDLARSFDAMAAALLAATQHQERLREELEQAVRHREDFVSIAAHELKTPLTNLGFQLQLLLRMSRGADASLEPATVQARSAAALAQSLRLGRLIETLLEASRLREGQMLLHPEDVDLTELAAEGAERMRTQTVTHQAEVQVKAPSRVVGRWDRLRMEQVVLNLLSNAVKYGDGKPVEVEVTQTEVQARLLVRDHGIGMSEEESAHAFERFERAASARAASSGLGLGLFVTQEIVHAHGGTISVRSTPGQGSEFLVVLPLTPASSEAAR